MKKLPKEVVLDLPFKKQLINVEGLDISGNCILDWMGFLQDSSPIYRKLKMDTPYRTINPQIILAEEGEAEATFFHKSYMVRKGNLILKPANTLFSIKSISKDWKMRMIEFKLPQAMQKKLVFFHLDIIELSSLDFRRFKSLFDVILDWLKEKETLSFAIEYLILAMLALINAISAKKRNRRDKLTSRAEELYSAFMEELLKEREVFQREASHYARRLGVCQNYLGNAVKEASHHSMMYWINNMSLHAAQELLRNKKLQIKDIAVKMGFKQFNSFSRFFKKHTGMTPGEYRNR